MTWDDVAVLMNNQLNQTGSSNKYRKEFTRKFKQPEDISTDEYETESDILEKIQEQIVQLRKEKTILSDLRRDANAQLRRIDREDSIKEIAAQFAAEMAKVHTGYKLKRPLQNPDNLTSRSGLLLLSDWHYGLDIDEQFNCYSPEICKQRLEKILDQTISIVHKEKLNTVYVYNLSDLISGRIHAQLRMQSRIDAVTQSMEVAEILYNFLGELSQYCKVEYFDCLDNHSRVEPNKKESLQLESFTRIIHWYLKSVCDKYRVTVHENNSYDIIDAKINGQRVIGVHGDNDAPGTVVRNMSSLFGQRPNLIVMAHRHHFSADEHNCCVVVSNPSLMGADRYALDKRMTSDPAQTLIIVSETNPVEQIYRLIAK